MLRHRRQPIAFLPSRSRRRRLQKRPLKSEFALL